MRSKLVIRWILMVLLSLAMAALALGGAAYFALAAIQNAWLSATPVDNPLTFKIAAIAFSVLAVLMLGAGYLSVVFLLQSTEKKRAKELSI